MKVQAVFTIDGFLKVFNDVFEVEQPTEQAVAKAITDIIGDHRIKFVFINFAYGEYDEQA